jgi:hypothetical protein
MHLYSRPTVTITFKRVIAQVHCSVNTFEIQVNNMQLFFTFLYVCSSKSQFLQFEKWRDCFVWYKLLIIFQDLLISMTSIFSMLNLRFFHVAKLQINQVQMYIFILWFHDGIDQFRPLKMFVCRIKQAEKNVVVRSVLFCSSPPPFFYLLYWTNCKNVKCIKIRVGREYFFFRSKIKY